MYKSHTCLYHIQPCDKTLCTNICMCGVCVLCRDQMGVVDVKVSFGQLDTSKEKNLLVWALGRHCAPENPFNASVYLKKET